MPNDLRSMDPAQFQYTYNNAPGRPEYPTPPPSYSHYHEFVPQPDHYQPYSATYNYEGFTQTPTPMVSLVY